MFNSDNILFDFSKQSQPRCAGYAIITYPQRERAEHKQKQRATSNESERGRSWRSLPHFVCNQVAWPHTFSRGYFICVPISGHVQFHLRRLTQRSIKPEGKSQRIKRFGSQKSSVKRVSGIGNIFPTKKKSNKQ